MIEFDVDMGYLLEAGELDRVVLNDENGEHEPMTFYPGGGECVIAPITPNSDIGWCSACGSIAVVGSNYCRQCGAKAVKR